MSAFGRSVEIDTGFLAVARQSRTQYPVLAFAILAAVFVAAVAAPWIAPYAPLKPDFAVKLKPPSVAHLFGTDALGRDQFSLIIYGARLSLLSGLIAVATAALIGVPAGLAAAYYGGWVDTAIMRASDIVLAFPPLLLPLALAAALGPSLEHAMAAIGIAWFPWYARVMRGSVLSTREMLYVQAARAMGASNGRIMRVHILPNSLTPVIVQASTDFGYAILAASSLSFIGVGARPPAIEWGLLAAQSRALVLDYWWTATFPGLAIALTVIAITLVADFIHTRLDPQESAR